VELQRNKRVRDYIAQGYAGDGDWTILRGCFPPW